MNTPVEPVPWTPVEATEKIRRYAREDNFSISYTFHAKDQMADRDLTTGDVLYVLKNGFVYEEAEAATQYGMFKYQMVCRTPNSNNRDIRVVTIPSPQACAAKVVTVMWVNEPIQGG